ncbi:MAG: immunoglobulin domain-containing protein [Candidatus Acidiferrales bacterium]
MKMRVSMVWLLVAVAMLAVAGCKNNAANNGVPTISVQPASQTTVTAGATVTFTVTASGSGTLAYQWFKNGVSVSGANSSSYNTGVLSILDNNDFFFVYISNNVGSVESNVANLTVNPATGTTTFHSDNARTGLNPNESTLAPGNVNLAGFGKVGFFPVDGAVDAQPLYLSEVNVPGKGVHNILYVATENDSVFAFDAYSGAVLWRANVAAAGETPGDNSACNPDSPNAGVSATPVIDPTRGPNGAIYLIAKSRDDAGATYERLHALDVSTGAELFDGPAEIPAALSGSPWAFDAAKLKAQDGLLVSNGSVYAAWSSPCGPASSNASSTGVAFVMAFDAENLDITGKLNPLLVGLQASSPAKGGTISADDSDKLYLSGIGSIRMFVMGKKDPGVPSDENIAAGPVILLPDTIDQSGKIWRLAVNAGADGNIYVLNRIGSGLNSNGPLQKLDGVFPTGAAIGGLAYFNNTVYVAATGSGVRAFALVNARLSSDPTSETSGEFGQGGASISVSASGSAGAIVWVLEGGDSGVLHAYDGADLSYEIYNSKQARNGRDEFGPGNASAMPLVVNGRVYVVGANGVAVFGLLK